MSINKLNLISINYIMNKHTINYIMSKHTLLQQTHETYLIALRLTIYNIAI